MSDPGLAAAPDAGRIVTAANAITAGRLLAVPLAAWLVLRGQAAAAFWVFVAAGLSDALDGWLARRGGGSRLGACLDPIADKALVVTLALTLAAVGALPVWLVLLVAGRDVLIVGGVAGLALKGRPLAIRPRPFSKLNTALQIALLALALADRGGVVAAPTVISAMVGVVTFTTLASGALYVWHAARTPMNRPRAAPPLADRPRVAPAAEHAPLAPEHLVPARASTRAQRVALLAGLAVAAWLALELFASVLLPFVAAAGIAYFLDPIASQMTRAGIPRGAAALILIFALLAGGLLAALLLYPLVISQIGLLIGRLPDYVTEFRGFAADVIERLQQRLGHDYVDEKLRDLVSGQASSMLGFLASALSRVIGGGFALFNVLSLLVVTPVVAFYLLRDWPRVVDRIESWLPRRYAGVLRAQGREVDRILSAWLRGQALCCIILALYYAIALSAVGLDLGLIVGLSAGMLSFIPYVGSITGLVLSIGLACAQFPTWNGVAMVAGVFMVGQILEGYVIYPRFLGDRVELHAVWVIFALFAGGAAFGFVGVLLAVPAAAVIGVLSRFWLRRYLESSLYLDPPGPGAFEQ